MTGSKILILVMSVLVLFCLWVGFDKLFYINESLQKKLILATATCFISMFCALVLGCLDKRAENTFRRSESASTEVVKLRDIIGVDCMFWLISVICVSYYVAIFPFIGLGK